MCFEATQTTSVVWQKASRLIVSKFGAQLPAVIEVLRGFREKGSLESAEKTYATMDHGEETCSLTQQRQ
jgi:hypothetical protein